MPARPIRSYSRWIGSFTQAYCFCNFCQAAGASRIHWAAGPDRAAPRPTNIPSNSTTASRAPMARGSQPLQEAHGRLKQQLEHGRQDDRQDHLARDIRDGEAGEDEQAAQENRLRVGGQRHVGGMVRRVLPVGIGVRQRDGRGESDGGYGRTFGAIRPRPPRVPFHQAQVACFPSLPPGEGWGEGACPQAPPMAVWTSLTLFGFASQDPPHPDPPLEGEGAGSGFTGSPPASTARRPRD